MTFLKCVKGGRSSKDCSVKIAVAIHQRQFDSAGLYVHKWNWSRSKAQLILYLNRSRLGCRSEHRPITVQTFKSLSEPTPDYKRARCVCSLPPVAIPGSGPRSCPFFRGDWGRGRLAPILPPGAAAGSCRFVITESTMPEKARHETSSRSTAIRQVDGTIPSLKDVISKRKSKCMSAPYS